MDRRPETATATTLVLEADEWPGHLAGQHVDVRLSAEDGYQASRRTPVSVWLDLGGMSGLRLPITD